jgi:hypothetical protein
LAETRRPGGRRDAPVELVRLRRPLPSQVPADLAFRAGAGPAMALEHFSSCTMALGRGGVADVDPAVTEDEARRVAGLAVLLPLNGR